MKWLLLLVVVFIGAGWWRQKKRAATPPATSHTGSTAERMVHCQHCGLHLPQTDAIVAKGVFYCSPEHLQRQGE